MAVMRYFEIVRYQVYAQLKAETARGGLGILWWVFDPVLYMFTFYIVFQYVLGRGGDDFIPFLITGLTAWKWFSTSVMQGAMAIQSGVGIMRQVHISKSIFPLVTVLVGTFKFIIILFMLMLFLIFLGYPVTISWLSLPLLVVSQLLLILFIAGVFSVIIPFFIDMKLILENALLAGMFLSGTFYDVGAATGKIKLFFGLNPMAFFMTQYRNILMGGLWPDFHTLILWTIFSLLGISYVVLVVRRLDCVFPKIIS